MIRVLIEQYLEVEDLIDEAFLEVELDLDLEAKAQSPLKSFQDWYGSD